MNKFGRNYKLYVTNPNDDQIEINLPFTLEFDVQRNSYAGVNQAVFKIYNLNEDTRAQIRRDLWDSGNLKKVLFLAGYGNDLSVAFAGNITKAWSVRQGVDFVTTIMASDGGFAALQNTINKSYPADTSKKIMLQDMLKSFESFGVKIGAIGNYTGKLSRGNSYSGNASDILSQLTGGGFFIDNEKAYALNDDEGLQGEVVIIDAKSGLLGTPLRESIETKFDMLFEPKLFIKQLITLDSSTFPDVNGVHVIIGLAHNGIISEAVNGQCVTNVTCVAGEFQGVRGG